MLVIRCKHLPTLEYGYDCANHVCRRVVEGSVEGWSADESTHEAIVVADKHETK
jgi:hypothetical protein